MTKPCPICGSEADAGHSATYGDRNQYACPRCGNYEISRTAQVVVKARIAKEPMLAALISHHLRMLQRQEAWPLVTTYTLDEIGANTALPTAKDQLHNLLLYLADKAIHPSELLLTPTNELIAVIGTVDTDGIRYIVQHAIDQGVLRGGRQGFIMSAEGRDSFELGLTVEGWKEVEELKRKLTKTEQLAMPLNDAQQSERLKVFMCHSKGDKGKVQELYKELVAAGADPWFDEEVLLPGQD